MVVFIKGKRKMKILIVMNYRGADWGGITGAVEELVASLKIEGFYINIATTHGKIRDRIKHVVHIFKIAPEYDLIMATGCGDYGFLPIFVGVLIARFFHKRVVVDFHEGYPLPFMNRFGKIIKLFLGNIPITVASKYLLDIFNKYKLNAYLIPHQFHYEKFPKRERPFSWNKKFMWVGTFQFMYDPETALKACEIVLEKNPDMEFYFFGKGLLLDRLRKKYSHPKIIFKGFLPRRELLKEYQNYCVFLNTSFGDNFPLRLVEAGFNEMLIISAKYGGTCTIYSDSECLFFERGDYKKLSNYIFEVIEKPHMHDSFRKNMHKKVMGFTWDKVRDNWLSLLNGR
ncbi:MAG: glycosyltransferase family 4 protein [Candidatus Omnitrophota bacterium]|jgi:glycosyltransferase involved in cell wall biosynthesis